MRDAVASKASPSRTSLVQTSMSASGMAMPQSPTTPPQPALEPPGAVPPPSAGGLNTFFTLEGPVGAEVASYAAYSPSSSGTLTLRTLPEGATIERALLYALDEYGSDSPSATFAGTSLGTVPPFATLESANQVRAFRWDVTGLVTGNGDYSA